MKPLSACHPSASGRDHPLTPSDLKRSIKAAIRAIASDPECGEPLLRDLDGLLKFRVRRFRIVYAIDRKTRTIRLMAVGHRRHIYEEVAAQVQKKS